MKLAEYLEEKKISQREFAKKAKVHYSTIAHLCSGRTKSATINVAMKICNAADGEISIEELCETDSFDL